MAFGAIIFFAYAVNQKIPITARQEEISEFLIAHGADFLRVRHRFVTLA